MDIFTGTITASIIVFFIVGNYAGRSVRELDDYFVAGRRAPTLLIVGTLVASVFSATIFLGEAGFTYDGQTGAYILFPGVAVIGYVYGALLFGTYLRRSRAPTVADYFGGRFFSHRVQQAAGLTIIIAVGCYLVVVTQGAAILLSDLTALSYHQGLAVAWFSYTVFTMYSGSKGVILTDTMMFMLFTFATVLVIIFVINDFGGIAASIESLARVESKPDIASWHGWVGPGRDWPTPLDFLIWLMIIDISWGLVYAVGPWQASRHLMARDEHVVVRSSVYTCIIVLLMQIFIYGLGGLVNIVNPDISPIETVIIWASKNMVPEILGAMLLAGIMAAALSSASTFLSLIGFSVSNDLVKRKEPLTLNTTRILMMFSGLIVLVASYFFPTNLFWLMIFVGTVFASSWGVVGIMSVWSKNITEAAAYWGMLAGLIFNVIPALFQTLGWISLPSYFDPALIGFAASLLVTLAVMKFTSVTAEEAAYRDKLHIAPREDCDGEKIKKTIRASRIQMLFGAAMPFIILIYYVKPFQRGSGTLLPDGSMDWFTGEAFLALTWPVVHIGLAIITIMTVRKRYGSKKMKQEVTND